MTARTLYMPGLWSFGMFFENSGRNERLREVSHVS